MPGTFFRLDVKRVTVDRERRVLPPFPYYELTCSASVGSVRKLCQWRKVRKPGKAIRPVASRVSLPWPLWNLYRNAIMKGLRDLARWPHDL